MTSSRLSQGFLRLAISVGDASSLTTTKDNMHATVIQTIVQRACRTTVPITEKPHAKKHPHSAVAADVSSMETTV